MQKVFGGVLPGQAIGAASIGASIGGASIGGASRIRGCGSKKVERVHAECSGKVFVTG